MTKEKNCKTLTPRAYFPRSQGDVIGDAVVQRNLIARRHVLLLLLGVLPEEEIVVWKSQNGMNFNYENTLIIFPSIQATHKWLKDIP